MIDNEAVVEFYDKFIGKWFRQIEEIQFSNAPLSTNPFFVVKLIEDASNHNLYRVLYTGQTVLAMIDHKTIYVMQELALNGLHPFTKEIEAFEAEYGCFVKFEYRKENKNA